MDHPETVLRAQAGSGAVGTVSHTMIHHAVIPRPPVQPMHLVPRTPLTRTVPPVRLVEPIACDPTMRALLDKVERIAACDLTVLVQGESGAGKEVLVQYLHAHSRRSRGPLVAENCSAIPESLAESLLFGHVRGSFTGADRDRDGLFMQASGGTLFLDEIGDMPLNLQSRLLRVLEERCVRPVGGQHTLPVDVRIVCATNCDLAELVKAGKFRSDLYYRLTGATLRVPALRERPTDIDPLALHFLEQLNEESNTNRRFAIGVLERLRALLWPGNVRELRNCVTSMFHLSDGDDVYGDLPAPIEPVAATDAHEPLLTRLATMREVETEAIQLALQRAGGNRREAARLLGISRSTIYVRIRELGL
jgi:DNA-binding NtrC family response regulator